MSLTMKTAELLFKDAALAWIKGVNSGDAKILARCEKRCDALREDAEALVKREYPGVRIDYPGLYPSFEYAGRDYIDLGSLIKWGKADAERVAS